MNEFPLRYTVANLQWG